MLSFGAASATAWYVPIGITNEDAAELISLIDNHVQSVASTSRRDRLRWLADQLRTKVKAAEDAKQVFKARAAPAGNEDLI